MNLQSTKQISERDLRCAALDVAICASGYEKRSCHSAQRLKSLSVAKRFVFGFTDRKVLSRESNDRRFRELEFEPLVADGNDALPILKLLKRELERSNGSTFRVFVDYSCMTRVWYAAIIDFFRTAHSNRIVELIFAYSPSSFVAPVNVSANTFIGPVNGFCQIALPTRDTALIVGLGYEQERALGLVDYVEPKETYAFYTDPALEPRFVRTVITNNAELLSRLKKAGRGYVIPHPLDDLEVTMTLLASLCSRLATSSRVILAPLGVKPFSLLCLLLAMRSSVDVWRVSAGQHGDPIDRPPLGPLLLFSATFVPSS